MSENAGFKHVGNVGDDTDMPAPTPTPTPTQVPSMKSNHVSRIDIESSPQDERVYSTIQLPNNLTALLISDPSTDKSAASLDVRVGHLCDPESAPGLAHFLEHMLFMGTEKYPDENDYSAFLSSHGGSSNAYTDMESTNFYFDVATDHLEGALDRFAQFFISPLFHEDSTERELRAVDSEHAKNLQNDTWRNFQLLKSLCRKDHPFSKFGTGNLKTLKEEPLEKGLDLRDMLLQFHATYYSANVMKLVVLGKESIDTLESIVQLYFADIANKNVEVPQFPGEPFRSPQLSKRLSIVPVQDGARSLEMHFPMREIYSLYLPKPTKYISHLIGHEGAGSILALLRHKGWANELSAGEARTCSDWSSFLISIDLTDLGLTKINEVVQVVFAYLSLLKELGPQEWIHQESSTVAACSFRFLSKRAPMDYVRSVAADMQVYPEKHVLSGPHLFYEYDPDMIEQFMNYFVPQNMLLAVNSKTFEGTTQSKEPIYGTEYTIETLSKELCDNWLSATVDSDLINGMLHLPEKNDMIASDFTLHEISDAPLDEPRLLLDSDICRLWYKPDNVFNMPKVNILTLLRTPIAATESPEASVLSNLWVHILQEHSTAFSYLASMASLHCSFVNTRQGIEITVSGFSHKAHILWGRIVKAMVDLPNNVGTDLFERIKDKVLLQYQNFLFAQPYQHAFYGSELCLELHKWSVDEKMKALNSIKINDVVDYSRRLLSRFHLEILVHGNIPPVEAKENIADVLLDNIKPSALFASNFPQLRVVQLQDGCDYVNRFPEPNPNNTNSCIEVIFQVGPMELHANAVLSLLSHLIREPAYNELRTSEQLGYIVHSSVNTSGNDVKGILFLIQSDSYDPIYMDERIEAFLVKFRSKIVHMTAEEFQDNVDSLVQNFLEKNKNIGEESSKYWSVITNNTYLFKKYQLIATKLEKVTKEDVLRLFDKYLGKDSPNRKKLSIQVFAKQHNDKFQDQVGDNVTLIEADGEAEFKRCMPLYPLAKKVDVESMKIPTSLD